MLKKTKAALENMVTPSKKNIENIKATFTSKLAVIRASRSPEDQIRLQEKFDHVLQAWGVLEEDIPRVISALRLRIVVFCSPLLLALVLCFQGGAMFSLFAVLPCIFVTIVGVFTTLWRINILKKQRFISFKQWLFLPLTK